MNKKFIATLTATATMLGGFTLLAMPTTAYADQTVVAETTENTNTPIKFTNKALEKAILKHLNQDVKSGEKIAEITPAKASTIEDLGLYNNKDEDIDITDISELKYFTNLRILKLGNTNVSDISVLSKLTNLTNLHLDFTKVSDVKALSGLTNLKVLDLISTKVSDVSPLAGLTNLERLHLDNNPSISNVSSLSKLTNLVALGLGGTKVTDASALLKNNTNLEWVSVNYSKESAEALKGLKKLGNLDITGNISEEDKQALQNVLPNGTKLKVDENSGKASESASEAPNLAAPNPSLDNVEGENKPNDVRPAPAVPPASNPADSAPVAPAAPSAPVVPANSGKPANSEKPADSEKPVEDNNAKAGGDAEKPAVADKPAAEKAEADVENEAEVAAEAEKNKPEDDANLDEFNFDDFNIDDIEFDDFNIEDWLNSNVENVQASETVGTDNINDFDFNMDDFDFNFDDFDFEGLDLDDANLGV